jgi:putative DNA-invertase from lambdoid prophage Rac
MLKKQAFPKSPSHQVFGHPLRVGLYARVSTLAQQTLPLQIRAMREYAFKLVWRLDRWGRSVADLVSTLQELQHLGVGFVSLTEALDLTTPAGRAMAGLLAVFAEFERDILRERVRAGLAHARQQGKQLGRPPSVVHNAAEVRKLCRQGISKSETARRLEIGRTSVRRLLAQKKS